MCALVLMVDGIIYIENEECGRSRYVVKDSSHHEGIVMRGELYIENEERRRSRYIVSK